MKIRIDAIFATTFLLALSTNLASSEGKMPRFTDPGELLVRPDISQISRWRFLTTVDFPPFSFIDSRQRLAGFNVDLVRAICAELGITDKCEIQALPFNELRPAIDSKQGESIIAGLVPSAEMRLQLDYSRVYFRFPARFVVSKNDGIESGSASVFPTDKRVGVIRKSAHERMLRAYFPAAKVVVYDRRDWLLDDLKSRKIDAAFGDAMRLSFWIGSTQSESCCEFRDGAYYSHQYLGPGLSIAFPLDRPELLSAANFALKALEDKGLLTEIYLKYFPVDLFN